MNTTQYDRFWQLYERDALPAITRACRTASRKLSEGQIDQDDLLAWINERVWKMLLENRKPTFHDDPTPEVAVERLATNANTLARWAYLGLCRAHWRWLERRQKFIDGMGRAERLATVSRDHEGAEKLEQNDEMQSALANLRGSLDVSLRQKLAASWPEANERERLAMAMGVAEGDDAETTQAMIDKVTTGELKRNAVEQMRSRARRKASDLLSAAARAGASIALFVGVLLSTAPAEASGGGEQGGGRGGASIVEISSPASPSLTSGGEQGGGRGGRLIDASFLRGEQGGGRGGNG